MNKTVLKEIRFEEKHKQNVLRTVGSLNNLSSSVIKKHRYSLGRKFTYSVCSVALLFTLFIGPAFFSPAMAEVVSKIPYLSKIFHSEPINRIIWGELEEKGYEINGVSGNASHILISLNGSEQYFQDVHEEVKEIAAKILKSNAYDRYTIKVNREIDIEVPPTSERERRQSEKH